MMTTTNKAKREIKVNGINREVLNSYSCGPGCKPHTYVVKGIRAEIFEHLGRWYLRDGGTWQPSMSGFYTEVQVEVLA